jgi:hypothetical protein
MPIAVLCPGCGAELNAPDSAAGKQVKCPRTGCGTLMIVPELLPAAEVPPAPRPRRRRDEDGADDRPRRREQAGLSPAAVAGIVLGGLLILGAVGYGVYALAFKKPDEARSGGGSGGSDDSKPAGPPGWVEYTSEEDGFRAYFPSEPQARPRKLPNTKLPPARSITQYTSDGPLVQVRLFVARLPPGAPPADRDAYAEDFNRAWRGVPGSREGSATWAGLPAREFIVTRPATKAGPGAGSVVRQVTVGDTLYGVVITSPGGPVPPEVVKAFLDNFLLLR